MVVHMPAVSHRLLLSSRSGMLPMRWLERTPCLLLRSAVPPAELALCSGASCVGGTVSDEEALAEAQEFLAEAEGWLEERTGDPERLAMQFECARADVLPSRVDGSGRDVL